MKENVYKITVKIEAGAGYKPVYKRGLCIAPKEEVAKKSTIEEFRKLDYEGVPVTISIHKIEKLPSQFILNSNFPN